MSDHFDLPSARQRQPIPAVCESDDIEEVQAEYDRLLAQFNALSVTLRNANDFDDWDAYDRAAEELDYINGALAHVERRLDELEQDAAAANDAEDRRDYWGAVI